MPFYAASSTYCLTRTGARNINSQNQLLGLLPRELRAKLLSIGQIVELKLGQPLLSDDKKAKFVYFPFSGFVSLLTSVDNHPAMEMALIGKEGMLGSTLLTGNSVTPLRAVVHAPGTALRIGIAALQKELFGSARLRKMIAHYLYLLLVQVSNTASCSNFHTVGSRLAKRLLTIQDRAEADNFHYTHQSLADMLGVRRSAVSIAAGLLQRQKCISYSRGNITIIDRKALEAVSCSCYKQIAYQH